MADITIIRNGARISLANFPKLGSGSENIAVAVSASGAYDTYTTELYYGWYQGSSMQKMLAQYQNGLYYIPSNALFNAGNVYLTLRLVSGGNKVSTNTIPITIEKSAVNNDYSILPASETWQSAVDNYISYTNSKLENVSNKADNNEARINSNEARINNLVANTGNSNSEIVDARLGYDNATYSSLGNAIRTQFEETNKSINDNKNYINDLNIIPIKNKVVEVYHGNAWSNNGILIENSGYDAVLVNVEGGKKYSLNKKFYGDDNFNVITDIFGNVIKKYTKDIVTEDGNIVYITTPKNAKYLKLTSNLTTYFDDFVVIEGINDILNRTIEDYPLNTVLKNKINVPIILKNGIDVENKFNDIDHIVGTISTQYINKTNYNDGHFWGLDTGKHVFGEGTNKNYSTIKVNSLKAGTYKLSKNYDAPLTGIENIATKYCELISNYIIGSGDTYDIIKVDFDFNFYMTIDSWRSKDLFMLVNGNIPTSYVYGDYEVDTSSALIKTKLPVVIYCGATRAYTTLKSAIEEATKYFDSTVYVDKGIYDLVQEFGTNYLDSYDGTENIGLRLKNRVRVVFSSGAKVIFNYQGTNNKINQYFSVFNAGEYGFTLENAWVESTNCRYTVHDERASANDSYHNIYKRCTFIHDSSQATGWHASQAIGGGLGKYGEIVIEDCYATSKNNDDTISYHSPNITSDGNDSRSSLTIRGTYTSGTIDLIPLGNSTKITRALITNCNLRIEPKLESGTVNNIEIVKWNNNIRE